MSCTEFSSRIDDYVDGTLAAAARAACDAHLSTCHPCRSAVVDFTAIRALAHALASHAPPARGWTRLADHVERAQSPARAWHWTGWRGWTAWQSALAAILLVAAIGGGTWLTWPDPDAMAPRPSPAPGQPAGHADMTTTEAHYSQAIQNLEQIATTNEAALDQRTAAVMRSNLDVIDRAIGESRAALETAPANDQAQESLFGALRSKVVLLQEMVTLINEMRQGNQDGAARIVSGRNP